MASVRRYWVLGSDDIIGFRGERDREHYLSQNPEYEPVTSMHPYVISAKKYLKDCFDEVFDSDLMVSLTDIESWEVVSV